LVKKTQGILGIKDMYKRRPIMYYFTLATCHN
jgi:hypothetical protein